MKKVYLVQQAECNADGLIDVTKKAYVSSVFTSKRKAEKCAWEYNEEWRENVGINKVKYYYYVETRVISH